MHITREDESYVGGSEPINVIGRAKVGKIRK